MYVVSRRTIFSDLAAIMHPIPRPIPTRKSTTTSSQCVTRRAPDRSRRPSCCALADARRAKEQAEELIRELLGTLATP